MKKTLNIYIFSEPIKTTPSGNVADNVDTTLEKASTAYDKLSAAYRETLNNVGTLSDLNILDGVDKNNNYATALQCVKGANGIGSGLKDAVDRAKSVRDAIAKAEGYDSILFDDEYTNEKDFGTDIDESKENDSKYENSDTDVDVKDPGNGSKESEKVTPDNKEQKTPDDNVTEAKDSGDVPKSPYTGDDRPINNGETTSAAPYSTLLGARLDMQSSNGQTIATQIAANQQKSEMERWKILQDTQEKVFETQQDITVQKAKEQDKMFGKWDEYVRS